jgi:predicted RNA polymerase sigma factor
MAGLLLLDGLALPGHRLAATRAELLLRAGRRIEAIDQFEEALARCENAADAEHLRRRLRISHEGSLTRSAVLPTD